MIQINIADHVSPQSGWVFIPERWRDQLRWARTNAFRITREIPSANRYFKTLPNGRTLTELLNDSSIWLNHDATSPFYGQTSVAYPKEVSIDSLAFRMGRWSVLATLVHELAHVNGAPALTYRGNARHRSYSSVELCMSLCRAEFNDGVQTCLSSDGRQSAVRAQKRGQYRHG